MLVLLALALIAQTPHTASVFHRLAPADGWFAWLHASSYAIALEFATLVFVVRKHSKLAWTFAIVSVLVNVAYYYSDALSIAQWLQIALVSLALPSCIAFYSHAMVEDRAVLQDEKEPLQVEVLQTTEPLQAETRTVASDLQSALARLQGDAKEKYLQLRNAGFGNAAICKALDIKSGTGASWWNRAQAQGAGD